jgi:hypothetical protein
MTHVFSFYGTISQCWDVFYSEYRRLAEVLGHPPFEFETPKHSIINEYVPKDDDEISVYFWDAKHKETLLVVEAGIVPDEDRQYNIFVHPQGNPFKEPVKSAVTLWKEIKSALKKDEAARKQAGKKRGPNLKTLNTIERLREIRLETIKNGRPIPKKAFAISEAGGISTRIWKLHDPVLWARWDDRSYK